MPTIKIEGRQIKCTENANLRRVLMDADAHLYNGMARLTHCRGLGTCGTCAIEVSGPVTEMTRIEEWRLSFPPHKKGTGLRLACQTCVLGDLEIHKRSGLWGNGEARVLGEESETLPLDDTTGDSNSAT